MINSKLVKIVHNNYIEYQKTLVCIFFAENCNSVERKTMLYNL